jgi:outer membrane protein assembly factor BamB
MPYRYAILGLLLAWGFASAQSPNGARLRGETEAAQTRKRIAEAQQKIAAGQSTEAVDELQRVLEESGNDLVLVKDNNFQPARRLVQLTLAGLPAEALKTYRDRLEAPAKKLLDAGVKNRDPKPLLELRERYFIARPTEKALDFLGELHFERGEFAEAERCWRMLLPASAANELVYPQPSGDAATYRAKSILAAFAAGEKARAVAELAAFTKDHPQAKGRLAGSDGPFAETLAKLFKTEEFNPAIGVAQTLPRFPAMRPVWKTPIPRDVTDKGRPRPASIPAAKTLAFHPAIVNGFAYIADAARVFAFDLKTGRVREVYDRRLEKEFSAPDAAEMAIPNLNGASFTLTVSEGKLYVRTGSTAMLTTAPPLGAKIDSAIIAFEVQPDGDLKKIRHIDVPVLGRWEGSPLVVDGKIIAAYRRIDDRGRLVHGIASYPENPNAKTQWYAEIAESDANQAVASHRQELLTLAGNKVVFTTHSGLTVALERSTGRTAWAFRNPPAAKPSNAIRDLCPPVYASGKVFIAPTDGDRLYALDAESGRLVWESAAGSVQNILGVADGKLIVAMSGPQKGIRGYRLSDGSTEEPFGWQNHDDPFLATYGKGIANENGILWPTMEKLYRLNPSDGSVQSLPKPGPHGNLAFGEGMLLVATPTEVWAYEGIPFAPEPESPKPFLPNKLIAAPKPAGEFDPLTAPTIRLPLELVKTEAVPVATVSNVEAVLVDTHNIGFANEHQLTATSCLTGKTIWGLDSLGRTRTSTHAIESTPQFSPVLLAAGNGVWVQTSQSERWFVDAKAGKILHREKTAEALWVAPPVALPLGKIVFSDGPGLVRCFDAGHRRHWSYEAGGEASLSGIPPQACLLGNALMIAVHRNYGIEIQRLDPNTGRALWGKPYVLNVQQFDWTSSCIDRTSLFIPSDNGVAALELGTGSQIWKAEQPQWGFAPKAVRGRHALFIYSTQPTPVESLDEVSQRVARRFFEQPRLERAVGMAGTLAEASLNWRISITAFDPANGQPEGFQEIPCGPGATVEFQGDKLVVRSPGTVSWWKFKE